MPSFNPDEYFSSKLADISITDKMQQVAAASEEKKASMAAFIAADIASRAEYTANAAATAKSWVGQLGLNPGSFVANRVNDAASLVSGASRLVGQTASLAPSAAGMAETALATPKDYADYNEYLRTGVLTPEMNRSAIVGFNHADINRKDARSVNNFFDLQGIVEQTNRNSLNKDLGSDFQSNWDKVSGAWDDKKKSDFFNTGKDVISGLAGLLTNAGSAAISNPSAVREYVIENAPQVLVGTFGAAGKVGLAASNIGYAADNYQQGMENYAKKNNGQLPPEEERHRMALLSASLALAEHMGELGQLKAGKAVVNTSADAVKEGFKKSLLHTAKAAAEGGLEETATEGYQTWAEGQVTGKPATPLEIYTGAVIGGVSGAGLSGGMHSVAEMTGSTEEQLAAKKAQYVNKTERDAVMQGAMQTGDVSVYTDPESKHYAPDKAINALLGHSQQADTTPEAKQDNLKKATQILGDLESKFNDAKDAVSAPDAKEVATYKQAVADKQAELATATPEEATALTEHINTLNGFIAEGSKFTTDEVSAAKKSVKQLSEQVSSAKTVRDTLADLVGNTNTVESMSNQVELVNTPASKISDTTVDNTTEFNKLVAMSMASPSSLSSVDAASMADNQANTLTEPQREYLRAFSSSRIAENTAKDIGKVTEDVLLGNSDKKMTGIKDYRDRISNAISTGNEKNATYALSQLANFEQDHKNKLDAVEKAYDSVTKTGNSVQIVSDGKGNWSPSTKRLDTAAIISNGGVTVAKSSDKLINQIKAESHALTQALAEQSAAVKLSFPSKLATSVAPKIVSAVQSVQPATPTLDPLLSIDKTREGKVHEIDTNVSTPVSAVKNNPTLSTKQVEAKTESKQVKQEVSVQPTEAIAEVPVAKDATVKTVTDSKEEVTPVVSPAPQSPASTEQRQASPSLSVQQTPDVAETSPIKEEVATEDQSGVLASMTKERDTNSLPFKERNLLYANFKQDAGKVKDATLRPLVAVKDFLSQWIKDKNIIGQFLKDHTNEDSLSNEQLNVLRLFKNKAVEWAPIYQKDLVKGSIRGDSKNFYFKDMIQFMIETVDVGDKTQLQLEENVTTAMSLAAFSYINEKAGKSQWSTPEEINATLNRDADTQVSSREYTVLGLVGSRENVVRNSLGQKAVSALGFKALPDASPDLMAKLESSIGAHIEKMLMDSAVGLMQRQTVSGVQMAQLTESTETDMNKSFQFLRIARQEDGTAVSDAQEILLVSKGTQGILDKLFSVESSLIPPSNEPITTKQKSIRNTEQGVPSELEKVIAKENKEASYLQQDKWDLLANLTDEQILAMMGMVEVTDATTHLTNRASTQAKNDGLVRELAQLREYVSGTLMQQKDGLDTPMFFKHIAWKNQRVGIETNEVNPQSSKMQRYMMYRNSWSTDVNTENKAEMDNFYLRVAEGLGVKTEKQTTQDSLDSMEVLLANPDIEAAVAVLVKQLAGERVTPNDQISLVKGVAVGGQNFHSLDALMALAYHSRAIANKETTFPVKMMGEVDGVTNGPMFTHLLMGAAETVADLFKVLNKGGFYALGDKFSQYNEYRASKGKSDLYESTAASMLEAIEDLKQSSPKMGATLDVIYAFTGKLINKDGSISKAGRDIIKTPLTALIFGSSVTKSIASMSDKFIESIYSRIEDSANGKKDAMSRADIINNLNSMLVGRNKIDPNTPMHGEVSLMEMELTKNQLKDLHGSFKTTLGKGVGIALNADFEKYLESRNVLNATAKLTFSLYDEARKGMAEAYVKELIQAEKDVPGLGIAISGKEMPIHDMSAKQLAVLKDRLKALEPIMHSLMSKDSNDLSTGLHISKSSNGLSTRPEFKGTSQFATPFNDGEGNKHSVDTTGFESENVAPGVAMVPVSMHSFDSAVSHYAAMQLEVLNVHDAHGAGLGTLKQAASNLNAAVWTASMKYSPASELGDALSRTLQGLDDLLRLKTTPPEVARNINNLIYQMHIEGKKKVAPKLILDQAMIDIRSVAYNADLNKFGVLSQLGFIDQYAMHGGNAQITDAQRAEALAKLNVLVEGVSKAEQTTIGSILVTLNASQKEQQQRAVQARIDEEEDPSFFDRKTGWLSDTHAKQLLDYNLTVENTLEGAPRAQAMRILMGNIFDDMTTNGTSYKEALISNADSEYTASNLNGLLTRTLRDIPNDLWGGRGNSVTPSDPALVARFEAKPIMTAVEALRAAYSSIRMDTTLSPSMKEFYLKLSSQLSTANFGALKVRYVTEATHPSQVLAETASGSRGWYAPTSVGEIYVLSPGYTHSGLTAELLLHELLHAALSKVIDGNQSSPEAKALVRDLDTLLGTAKEYVEANPMLAEKYKAALSDVHELVSWGMTNRGFQTDVLNKVSMVTATKGNALVTGMQILIKALTGFFFKEGRQTAANGMSVLIANVSGMMAESAKTKTNIKELVEHANLVARGMASPDMNTLSTHDIYDSLRSGNIKRISYTFDEHLKELLGDIVYKLHGPFGTFKSAFMKNPVNTAADAFQNALASGIAPFASKSLAAGFTISEQEAFVMEQVEVTVREAINQQDATTSMAYKELLKLYEETRSRLKVADFHKGDWTTANQAEKDEAQALHDFIFKTEANRSQLSDYLSRFAAMGMAHEGFNKLLQVESKKDVRNVPVTFFDRLENFFHMILGQLHDRMVHTFDGQHVDQRLNSLVQQLVGIESKKRMKLSAESNQAIHKIGEVSDQFAHGMKDKLEEFGRSALFKESKNAFVRATGAGISAWNGDRVGMMMDGLQKIRNEHFKGKQGWVMGVLTDVRGHAVQWSDMLRATKQNEQLRERISTTIAKSVMGAFKDGGKYLTKESNAAVTAVLLRTGAHALLGKYSMSEVGSLLSNPTFREAEIAAREDEFSGFEPRIQEHFKIQAKALAYHNVTGKATVTDLMLSPGNIAQLYKTPFMGRLTEAQIEKAEATLDVLVTLYALGYSKSVHRESVIGTLRTENARNDGNGIEALLLQHQKLDLDSQDKLFASSEALRVKGYLPEVYNPYIEIKVGYEDGSGQDLLDQGYSEGAIVARDPSDPDNNKKRMYVTHNGGLTSYLSAIFSLTGLSSKGSSVHDGNTSMFTVDGQQNVASMVHIEKENKARKAAMPSSANFDPTKVTTGYMVPLLNNAGEAVNYRYMMQESTKDTVLERDNRFEELLGNMAGSTFDKVSSVEQNRAAVKLNHEQFLEEYATNSGAYIKVGADSADPEMRDIYRLLPDSTKKAIKEIWGTNSMMVRTDLLDMNFGYRKLSMANMFTKDMNSRTEIEKATVWFTEMALKSYGQMMGKMTPEKADKYRNYDRRAAMIVRRNERIWQEIVKEVKSNIVIKGGVTMIGNITSNLSLLMIHGVPTATIIRDHIVGWKGAMKYQQDRDELDHLKNRIEIGYVTGDMAETRSKIVRLEDALARNPVHALMEAGLMPSIVEDMGSGPDIYSYKSQMTKKLEGITSKLNPGVVAVGKQGYMAQDTGMFQALNKITQLSDFVARYTLYKHLTTKENNPMEAKEAMQEALESFIVYDTPMYRGLQYTDDMGITPFMKYFIRIQRVLAKLAKDHPTRFMAATVMNHFMHIMPIVTDSSAFAHIGRLGLASGALQYGSSVKSLATVQGATALFRM